MDPDKAYRNAMAALAQIERDLEAGRPVREQAIEDMVTATRALDEWLKKGGYLPRAWQR